MEDVGATSRAVIVPAMSPVAKPIASKSIRARYRGRQRSPEHQEQSRSRLRREPATASPGRCRWPARCIDRTDQGRFLACGIPEGGSHADRGTSGRHLRAECGGEGVGRSPIHSGRPIAVTPGPRVMRPVGGQFGFTPRSMGPDRVGPMPVTAAARLIGQSPRSQPGIVSCPRVQRPLPPGDGRDEGLAGWCSPRMVRTSAYAVCASARRYRRAARKGSEGRVDRAQEQALSFAARRTICDNLIPTPVSMLKA